MNTAGRYDHWSAPTVHQHPWPYDSRGREAVTPEAVTQDHERLHQIVESAGYQQPAQVFRVPTVWPHVMA